MWGNTWMGRWAGKTETPIFTPWIEEAHHKEKAHNQRWERGGPSTNPHKWIWGSEPVNNKSQSLTVGTAWRTLGCLHAWDRSLRGKEVHTRLLEFANTLKTIIEMKGQVNPNLRFTKMIKQLRQRDTDFASILNHLSLGLTNWLFLTKTQINNVK